MMQRMAVVCSAVLLGLLVAFPASAATIAVTTTVDVVDAGDGLCSLREAITAVNTEAASGAVAGECVAGDGNADSVILGPGTFALSLAGADEDANASGDLDILASVRILGAGMDQTTIDAAGFGAATDRIVDIPAVGIVVSLEGLAMINGHAPDALASTTSSGEDGGAIRIVNADVTLTQVALRDNQAGSGDGGVFLLVSGNGGAVAISGGSLALDDSVVAHNHGTTGGLGNVKGGGIFASNATVSITRTSIESNSSDGGTGGGIQCVGSCALAIDRSSITGNSANGGGGGIYMNGTSLEVANSTIANNVSAYFAAGLYVIQETPLQIDPVLEFVTLTGNQGVGFAFFSSATEAGTAQLRNSIVAGNTEVDCSLLGSGSFGSQGYNLLGASCPVGGNDITAVAPLRLSPLSLDFQGLTWTMLPQPTSAATNAGNCAASSLYVDQRDVTRPQGVPRVVNKFDGCDIGAAELGDVIFWDDFEVHASAAPTGA